MKMAGLGGVDSVRAVQKQADKVQEHVKVGKKEEKEKKEEKKDEEKTERPEASEQKKP